jgi:hypothetical protein
MKLRDEITNLLARELAKAACGDLPTEDDRIVARQMAPAVEALVTRALERAAVICEEQAKEFLAPEYATGQPLSSFQERYACNECARAIRAEIPPTHGEEK